MIIRDIGGAPFIIDDELYNSQASSVQSITIDSYTTEKVKSAFIQLFYNLPAVQRSVIRGYFTCPAVVGWDAPIQANTMWLEVYAAAIAAGFYQNISASVPVGGTAVTYPDGTSGTLTGAITTSDASSILSISSARDLYSFIQDQSITSYYYRLPRINILVLPESVLTADNRIDVTGNTSRCKAFHISATYRSNYKQVHIECGMSTYGTEISTLTKLNGYEVQNITNDPYVGLLDDTPSTTGGGHGTGDFSTDTIAESDAPTITAIDSGFISVYSPSLAQLNALAGYMWTSSFETNLKKLFGDNAMGTIIGLGVVPVTPPIGGSRNVVLGNVDTGVPMPVVTGQYVKVDCGSITLLPKYDAFLDYEPYTGIDLFLPYIGTVQLSVNDVMGKTIRVVYIVDVISGACVAEVLCNGSVYYTFNGCCLTQFPVTNNDYSNVFHSAIQAAISLSSAIAGAFGGSVGSVVSGVAGAANSAINAHPVVNRSGSVAGSCGAMGVQVPYLIMSVPKMVDANAQNAYIGYPNFTTVYLSSVSGYTEVENINITGLHATQQEQDEIKKFLKEGVIF